MLFVEATRCRAQGCRADAPPTLSEHPTFRAVEATRCREQHRPFRTENRPQRREPPQRLCNTPNLMQRGRKVAELMQNRPPDAICRTAHTIRAPTIQGRNRPQSHEPPQRLCNTHRHRERATQRARGGKDRATPPTNGEQHPTFRAVEATRCRARGGRADAEPPTLSEPTPRTPNHSEPLRLHDTGREVAKLMHRPHYQSTRHSGQKTALRGKNHRRGYAAPTATGKRATERARGGKVT